MSFNGHTPTEEPQPNSIQAGGNVYSDTATLGVQADPPASALRLVNPASLQPHPDNYNLHPPEQITELKASLKQFSQVKNVVTWRGLILAGHGLVTAALEAGLPEIEARDVSEWPPEKAVAYLVADNETARMGQPDYARLQGLVNQAKAAGVVVPGVSGERLEEIAREARKGRGEGDEPPPIDQTEAEKYQAIWQVKPGDLWELGRHKVACLDSLDEANVRRLVGDSAVAGVWADPPYGIAIVGSNGHIGASKIATVGKYAPVIGDNAIGVATKAAGIYLSLYGDACHVWWGANHYSGALPASPCWIVWDKRDGLSSNYFADCELAWTNRERAARIFGHRWSGMLKASEQGQRRVHPTQKPVALAEECFRECMAGGLILDPFLGSGISVLGAERLGPEWSVIGFELAPEYIATTIQRWVDVTQQDPHRL